MENLTRFERFMMYEHPDPDHFIGQEVHNCLREISNLAEAFHKKIGKENCASCGRPFNSTDKKLEKSRPKSICVACFTSNA